MVLEINTRAPAFTLPNQTGKDVSLKDFLGKWIILYFYPKDNTPGCTLEAQEFTAAKHKFAQLDCEVVGISADSIQKHESFCQKYNLSITLLSDEEKHMVKAYDVWQPKKFMGREFLGIVRSTYLVDPNGKIKYVWSPVRVKGHVDEVLKKLEEIN